LQIRSFGLLPDTACFPLQMLPFKNALPTGIYERWRAIAFRSPLVIKAIIDFRIRIGRHGLFEILADHSRNLPH
jgi:hypothetical protein